MKINLMAVFILMSTFVGHGQAQEVPGYGDFRALQIDQNIVKDVIVENNDIYVKLDPIFRNKEISVRISDLLLGAYRIWSDGELEKTVKIYNSNQNGKMDYTYRINTIANFVEYWIDDDLVLHLERVE
ncbi:MAG: hypothetical protein HQM13_10650 [SAR324 cluster bacterium]|nr:hypothetical protein [SAR324 cluster bacterium]